MGKKRITPRERELAKVITIERLLKAFIRRYSRPKERHEPLIAAVSHVVQYRHILVSAMKGDQAAQFARRQADDESASLDPLE
jgi:hypothetical protein